jgi:hypothetical protein
MITPFWVHVIRNILITDADTFSPFEQNSIYEDLLIALQLAHDTKATPSAPHTTSHPTSTDSGNYGPAPMDLSAAKKSQNQCRHDERMAKGLCLYCGSADHFKDQCSVLASNNARKVRLAAAGVSTPDVDSVPSPASDSGKE